MGPDYNTDSCAVIKILTNEQKFNAIMCRNSTFLPRKIAYFALSKNIFDTLIERFTNMIIGLWGTGEQAVSRDGMWRRNHTRTPHWIGAPKRKKKIEKPRY